MNASDEFWETRQPLFEAETIKAETGSPRPLERNAAIQRLLRGKMISVKRLLPIAWNGLACETRLGA